MNILILKLGATGDVVRTTPLVRTLDAQITWITSGKNAVLLDDLGGNVRCFTWEQRESARDCPYDLAINLEDTDDVAQFLQTLTVGWIYGAYSDSSGVLRYTDSSRCWFDLSLISRFGRREADRLKLQNRRTYQDLIFEGLGLRFEGETYLLPKPTETGLRGDVAIAPEAGPVWPMKNWAYYDTLKRMLESEGLVVNLLPQRATLLEHLGDVQNHRCLVGGDSLPMHFALGAGIRCVTLFNCTSPWEIYDYGLQRKFISPRLGEFFYQRGFNPAATTAIGVDEVFNGVMAQVQAVNSVLA